VIAERTLWRGLAAPGIIWLILFVVVPAYAVVAVAMGKIDTLLQPVPVWNPLEWNVGFVKEAFASVLPGGTYWSATRNTLVYVFTTVVLCFAIGYPVAYYIARCAGRTKGLLLLLIFLRSGSAT
jgi:spermidine/putrescine transport system permease protein